MYVAVATPVLVVAVPAVVELVDAIFAKPCAVQVELNVIVAGCVYRVPSDCCNATVKVALPPAERLVLEMPIADAVKTPVGLKFPI